MVIDEQAQSLERAKAQRDSHCATMRMISKSSNSDRLNHAPDKSDTALLLIDVINGLEFEGGERLLPHAIPMAAALADLKKRAKAAGVPAIYANDNFGRWQSDFRKLVQHCLEDDVPGKQVVVKLAPEEDDYFVLKPKHSAFFQTNLDVLLKYLGAQTLILTGLAGDNCVFFSANDAYMRDFNIIVPADCTASEDAAENHRALLHMQRVLKATISPSSEITFTIDPNARPGRQGNKRVGSKQAAL